MWIVRLALNRPYTFVVLALLLFLVGPVMLLQTPVDIFPEINIPVVSIIWSYNGMVPSEMERRVTSIYERALTTTVGNVEHIESQSLNGVAVIKVFLQPQANVDGAIAQVTAEAQATMKQLPEGITPPLVIRYSASTVPILQLGLNGRGLSEQQLNDFAANFIRPQLATIPGAAVPLPYGGKVRQIMVDIDSNRLQTEGLSPLDVVECDQCAKRHFACGYGQDRQHGVQRRVEWNADHGGGAERPADQDGCRWDRVYPRCGQCTRWLRGTAEHRSPGWATRRSAHRREGRRHLYSGHRRGHPQGAAADRLHASSRASDTSSRGSIGVRAGGAERGGSRGRDCGIADLADDPGVFRQLAEYADYLCLHSLVDLTSLLVLSALGQSINIMTLGGLALAVGVLVDDATVEIENMQRNLALGKDLREAILDGAEEIAVPAFVSTVCICIVFVPMFFLPGVAHYLFVPLAEAVVFAMFASYFFSRTIIPTMVMFLLPKEVEQRRNALPGYHPGWFARLHGGFEHAFDRLQSVITGLLSQCLAHRKVFIACFLTFCLSSLLLLPYLGQDFFPAVDAGQFRLHVRAQDRHADRGNRALGRPD